MVFRDKLVCKDLKGERGKFLSKIYLIIDQYIKFILGGTAPGFWGAVGVPGARGRPGGKLLLLK